jgi:two-component system cell cycle response regulator DivK
MTQEDERTAKSGEQTAKSGEQAVKSGEQAVKSGEQAAKSDAQAAKSDAQAAKSDAQAAKSDTQVAKSGEQAAKSGEQAVKSGEQAVKSGEQAVKSDKPIVKSDEQKKSDNKPRAPIEPTQAHVLVVEDNVPNFVLIARMLAYMGVQRCEWKTSGWQVVEFADTLPRIDLILMDIRLPYEDGFQALEKLRANPRLKDTLVVAVTAEASVEQMKRAQKSGFDGFLGKPLDPDRFPNQIRRVLSGEPVWEVH